MAKSVKKFGRKAAAGQVDRPMSPNGLRYPEPVVAPKKSLPKKKKAK